MLNLLKKMFFPSPTDHRGSLDDVSFTPKKNSSVADNYFSYMAELQNAISKRDYQIAASFVHKSLDCLPEFIRHEIAEWGELQICSIPCLEQGGTILALLNDVSGLEKMENVVASMPELKSWEGEGHEQDRCTFIDILEAISANPNCLQTEVKKLIGAQSGRRIGTLISYLEKSKKIVRTKEGRTYRICIADPNNVSMKDDKAKVSSHRADKQSPKLKEIDISSLAYTPLPKAPASWEGKQRPKKSYNIKNVSDFFEIRDADWTIQSVEKIPMKERPDPAYRKAYAVDSGLLMIDDLGNAEGLNSIESSAIKYDRKGRIESQSGFQHGSYRIGVNPLGNGLILMSKDCVVHAYDDQLQPLFETALDQYPEIKAMRERFCLEDENQLKNHIRCVALSRDNKRYLFTIVDEAWCMDVEGKGLWGVKFPIQEGWKEAITVTNNFGTREEINNALALMNLSLPVTPKEINERYRDLAKEWHPDLNQGNIDAAEQMKALNTAKEILTGVDGDGSSNVVTDDIQISIQIGGSPSADWIYASCFSASSDKSYLASYSGLVVTLTSDGDAVRVYDIGSVPKKIIDTGDYLYLLTDTRLYVLQDDSLYALIDTYDSGELIMTQTGFGLLEKKRLQWFNEDGTYLGSILSKDPIRRVYTTSDGVVIETRQRRAVLKGIPTWWE